MSVRAKWNHHKESLETFGQVVMYNEGVMVTMTTKKDGNTGVALASVSLLENAMFF